MLAPKTFKINLIGTVSNEKTNEPLQANVEIRVKDSEPIKLRSTAGKFERRSMPETFELTVAASQEGFLPKEQKITLPLLMNDTTINVELLLKPIAKKLILSGSIYDKKTEQLLPNAHVEVSLNTAPKTKTRVEATGGNFEREVSKLGWYILTASSEGYMNSTDSIWFNKEDLSPLSKDLYLQPIEVGVTVRLKNIYFDFDKTTLQSQSFVELNKVVEFLKENHTVEIEIEGHTDSKGSDDYNLNLSQGRSQSVVDYLISQGIEGFRLNAHGFGETKPIDTNDSEEGRANNRRVEFTVVKK
jgi:OOP family OmpA-OmpF porin